MNEIRQFMRYVIPGLLFFVELFLYILITNFYTPKEIWGFFSNAGGGINLLLLSTGVGFIFSIIHHFLYWTFWCKYNLAVDHRKMLNEAIQDNYLKIRDIYSKTDINPYDINQREAWGIVCKIWHTRKETSKIIKSANDRIDSLSDLAHGSGTALIGSIIAIIAFLVFLFIKQSELQIVSKMIALMISFILFFIHCYNYKQTIENVQHIADSIIYQELKREKIKNQDPINILWSKHKKRKVKK